MVREEESRELDKLLADPAIALEGGARVFTWIWLAHTLGASSALYGRWERLGQKAGPFLDRC
jgi:hypothetical protein